MESDVAYRFSTVLQWHCSPAAVAAALTVLLPAAAAGAADGPYFDRQYYRHRTRIELRSGYADATLDPDLPRNLQFHGNHPDDSFLRGDPGRTPLDAVRMAGLVGEVGLARRLGNRSIAVIASYAVFAPLSKSGRFERQQANDPRPAAHASFVYTRVAKALTAHALRAGLGVGFIAPRTKLVGVEVQALLSVGRASATFEKGWSRFGRDAAERTSTGSGLLLEPLVRVAVKSGRWSMYAAVARPSVRFSHADPDLEDHTGSGTAISFGARLSFDIVDR